MINKTIFDNGIRVISEHIPHVRSVSVGIWVANGSRHETRKVNGVSHFIEHLLFKGTPGRTSLDIAREIDSMGGLLNAFTGREFVCYYAKVLDAFLPRAVDLLADIFLNPLFDADELEKERQVILQEIRMHEDSPEDYISDLLFRSLWQDHPLGMSIIGSEESVSGLSRDCILAHKQDSYRAGDIVITAAGKVDHRELLKLLSGLFDSVPTGNGADSGAQPIYARHLGSHDKELEQVHCCFGVGALPQNHPQRYELCILNTILGGSMSSRLFQEIREKEGLAYSIYSFLASHSDAGALAVYAGTSRERLEEVIGITLREIRRMKNEALTSIELDAAKEQLKGNIVLSLESSDNRMSKLAKNEIYFGCYQPLEEVMAGIDRVTAEGVLELANTIFDDRHCTLQLMGELDGFRLKADDVIL